MATKLSTYTRTNTIRAFKWDGKATEYGEVVYDANYKTDRLRLNTDSGQGYAFPGDYIVVPDEGKPYAVTAAEFEATYEVK